MMPSFQSRLLEFWLRVTGAKAVTNMIDLVYPLDAKHAKPTRGMKSRLKVETHEFKGRTVYTVSPRGNPSGQHVFFLHGGAYYNSFIAPHWVFIEEIVKKTGCTFTAPDFPLAPEAGVDDIFAMVEPLFKNVVHDVGSQRLTLMGDSSGGGLALALANRMRDQNQTPPKRLVLLSPWLDVTMSNPAIEESNRKDPYIGWHACVSAGKRYAKNDDPRRPDISPIYGHFKGLPRVTLFIGTHDIMHPDCEKLCRLMLAAGVEYDHRVWPDMVHDWMFLNLPESEQCRAEIANLVSG